MGFDEHAAHTGLQFQHQERRFHRVARLVAQVQPDGVAIGRRLARQGVDAQAQALATQCAVRPGKGTGIVITRRWQPCKQGAALGGVECVEPARIHPGGG